MAKRRNPPMSAETYRRMFAFVLEIEESRLPRIATIKVPKRYASHIKAHYEKTHVIHEDESPHPGFVRLTIKEGRRTREVLHAEENS